MSHKIVEDAVKAMASAAVEIRRLTNENVELLKETFELAGQNEKLKYRNDQLVVALQRIIEVRGERDKVLIVAESAIREAENG